MRMSVMRVLRVQRGLTLVELGQMVGLSEAPMSRIERRRRALDADRAHRIAEALGVDVGAVFVEVAAGRYEVAPLDLVATG